MKLNEVVETVDSYINEWVEGDCSICPFGNMTEDGRLHCGYAVFYNEDEIECGLNTKEKIKQEIIKAVDEERTANNEQILPSIR